jgi:hypothetical protein
MRVCQVDTGHLGRISVFRLRCDMSNEDYGHLSHLDQKCWIQPNRNGFKNAYAESTQLRGGAEYGKKRFCLDDTCRGEQNHSNEPQLDGVKRATIHLDKG